MKLRFAYLLIAFQLVALFENSFAHEDPKNKPSLIRFTENKNQWESFIKYRAQLDGGALFLQKNQLTYHFYDKDTYRSIHANPKVKFKPVKTSWFHVQFISSNADVKIISKTPSSDYTNYFIGNDKNKWAANVKHYKELVYENLWQGIDLQMIGSDNSIKYNFYVQPHSNPANIQLYFKGTKKIKLENGNLLITSHINEIIEHEPYAYQIINGIKIEVPCKYKLKNNILSYDFPKGYDENYELIIDPVLVFACSSGSTADNFGMTATYDNDGNLYSGGTAFNIGFPTTTGAYDSLYSGVVQYGQTDVVITKYDSSGAFLQYSTYLGGANATEVINSLIVDTQNNLYAYGATSSSDFPTHATAYDQSFAGGNVVRFVRNGAYFEYGADIYVAKLNNNGTNLLGSTFIGGSRNDGLNYTVDSVNLYGVYEPVFDSLFFNYGDQNRGEIQLDQAGNVIVASSTRSTDFPIINGFDNSIGGWQDAVIFKLTSDLNTMMWSTYFGGSSMDAGFALCLDANDNVFITGGTCSRDLAVTAGVIQTTYGGGKADGYIAKIKNDGTQLLHTTYLGIIYYDQCFFVQQDNDGDIYVLGQAQGNFPVINATYSNNLGKIFITKMDSTLSTKLMQTVIGNGVNQIVLSPSAFLVDCAKNIYFSGWGGNIITGATTFNMPLTSNAYQSSNPDGHNFYLMALSPNAGSLLYATYFGGPQSEEHVDGGTSRFDKKGIIYQSVCAGCGNHDDFPVTPGAWPTSVYGNDWNQSTNCNNGTFKFNFEFAIPKANISASTFSGCAPLSVTFTNTSISAVQYLWDFGNNDTSSSVNNPIRTFTTPGTYIIHLYARNTACYNVWDTATVSITVLPTPTAQATSNIQQCSNTFNFTNTSFGANGLTYSWDFGDNTTSALTSPSHTYATNGNYTVTLITTSDLGCKDSLQIPVQLTLTPDTVMSGGAYCSNLVTPVQLNASGGTSYSWLPASGLSNASIANPVANPITTTVYSVTISETDFGGNTCTSTKTVSIIVHPAPTAQATATIQPCTNTFDFANTSSGANGLIYNWDFGDNSQSALTSPSHTYINNGTYTVTLNVTSDMGCKDSIKLPVQLILRPDSVGPGGAYCADSMYQLPLFASGGTSYTWLPSIGLNSATIANPIANPLSTTIYSVTISEMDFGGNVCASTKTVSIQVNPAIVANFDYTFNACVNTLHFNDLSIANAISWDWNFGDTFTSVQQNPVHSYAVTGTYNVSLAVKNSFGCNDTIVKPITLGIFDPLGVSATQKICYGGKVQLSASGGIAYSWSPANSLSNDTIANPFANPISTTIYTVTITSVSSTGDTCYSDLYTKVIVSTLSGSQLVTSANPDTIYAGDYSNIHSNLSSPYTISWSPNYQLSSNTSFNPTATPLHTTTYVATVQDVNGCRYLLDSVTIYVLTHECDEGTIYVPNTFTPNNDGKNDMLFVRSNHTTEIYFAVYNRWGELVFETNDITKGWDGTYKGMLVDPGVFGYYVRYTCDNDKKGFKKGNVTLIR